VVVGDFSRLEVLTKVGHLYDGSHLEMESVMTSTTRKLTAAPVEADAIVPIELDGETPGRLPAVFEVLPAALRVRI
jgi:diacylglycerol kinase family enzyme